MNNFNIAWRNLWRNSRRSIITMASVFFGVILSTLMTSMQHGSYDAMIDNVVKFYSGYAQVFTEAYHENKTINNTFELTDSIYNIAKETPQVTNIAPRLEYFALASSEELTKGAMIIGIDPEKENKVTDVKKWVETGQYLEQGDKGVLIAIDLANYLKVKVGDTLILYGQGYHGVTSADLFPIRGILNFPMPELNKQLVYMDLATCQNYFGADNMITSLVIMVEDHYDLPKAMRHLKSKIKSPLMVMSWDELQPELVQMIEADRAGGVFMKLILYMVVAFGIFGTIIMMMAERIRELGVTIAIGMQRFKMGTILFIETILTGIVGTLIGIIGSIPVISYFFNNPIKLTGDAAQTMIDMGIEPYLYFSWNPPVFYNQALVVFLITIIIGIFPVYKALNLKVNQALRA
ncbi:MAG: ABC transporter permease [Bacteroidales bacterium]|nr:ABC transporter permease [Bacteroidales bacterium]